MMDSIIKDRNGSFDISVGESLSKLLNKQIFELTETPWRQYDITVINFPMYTHEETRHMCTWCKNILSLLFHSLHIFDFVVDAQMDNMQYRDTFSRVSKNCADKWIALL